MSTVMTTVERWQGEFFDFMDRVEEPVVKFAEERADKMAEYVPERPEWPFLAKLPTMTEVVENQLVFTSKFVETQAAFVRKVMKAMHPALVKWEVPKKAARKTTPRTVKAA